MKKPFRLLILSLALGMTAGVLTQASFSPKNEVIFDEAELPENYDPSLETVKCEPAYNSVDQYYNWQNATTAKQAVAYNHLGDISKVWDKTKGEGIRIAIIDSGIDADHPDFKYDDGTSKIDLKCARYYANVTGDSTSGYTVVEGGGKCLYFEATKSYKINGKSLSGKEVIAHNGETSHGTNTASTAASAANPYSKTGCIGMAPMATIIPIKVDMYSNSIYYALQYLHSLNTDSDPNNNIDVVNISIVGYDLSNTYYNAVTQPLYNDKTIIVASAGNDAKSNLAFPAADRYVIGVGALEDDSSTDLASYSNFNSSGQTESTLCKNTDLVAPGKVYCADYNLGSTYKNNHGTSFASPIVAGAACLWKSLNKTGTVSSFKDALLNSCVDIGASGWDAKFGKGRLDIGALIGVNDIVDTSSVSLNDVTVKPNETVQLTPIISPTNATSKDYLWWSDSTSVATVDENGLVSGVKEGTAVIHCKSMQNDNAKDTCTVTVSNSTSGSDTTSDITNPVTFTFGSNDSQDIKTESGNATKGVVTVTANGNGIGATCLKVNQNRSDAIKVESNDSTAKLISAKLSMANDSQMWSSSNGTMNGLIWTSASENGVASVSFSKGGGSGVKQSQVSDIEITLKTSGTSTPTNYTVSFNPNGGSGTMASVTTNGSSYVVPACTFTKANYEFDKWALNSATGTKYDVGTTISNISSNITLYATWKAKVVNYSVSFNANGGSGTMSNVTTNGSSYVTPSCNFSNSGYTFDGWALNSTSGTKYTVGQSISGISSDITLYAIWKNNSSSNYYGSITDDMTGDTLKSQLHNIINNSSVSVSYDWPRYEDADEDPNNSNNIITIYARTSLPKSSHISNNKGWNREHTFPQSKMDSPQAEKDNHIIFASDYKVNGTRSNKKLMDLSSTSGTTSVVDSYGNATVCKTNSNYFDPGDTVARGYVARSTLYAAVMYDFDLLDNFDSIATVLSWNLNYYPTSNDERRNNIVYNNQKNRNPFVDHPEYACKIWGNTNSTTKQICGIGTEKTLSSITLSGNYKTTFDVDEDFTYSGLVVTANYSSGSPSTVTGFTVSSPDMTTAGTKTVTVSYTEGSVTKTATYDITVKSSGSTNAHTTGLTLDKITATVNVGSTINLVATKIPSDSVDPVTWSSSDSSVATVSNGTVTAVKAGTATITATSNGITATCTVTVDSSGSTEGSTTKTYTFSSSTDFSNITIGDVNLSIVSNGGSNPLWNTSDSAARIYHHGKYTFTSEKKIVSITFNFKNSTQTLALSANKGTYSNPTWTGSENEVIFTTSGSSGHNKVLSITVVYEDEQSGPKVTSVILDPKTLSFDLYQSTATKTITATVLGDSGVDTSVVWTSSKESVATVVNGVVTPVAVGEATITATSTADSTKFDTCVVTISDSTPVAVSGVTLNKGSTTLIIGSSETLIATVNPSNAGNKNVTWSTNNASVATVSNGIVNAIAAGTATITVTTEEGGYTATCAITVTAAPVITYQLEADQETVPYMSGTNHQVSVSVKLYQYSNGVKGSQVASSTGSVDTSVLGPAKISYTYQSVTYETSVKVTNNGAIQNIEGTSTKKSSTFTKSIFTKNETQKVDDLSLTLQNNGGYYGYDATKGQQIGSSGSPAESMSLTTSVEGTITKVIVNTSGGSSVSATVSVKVGTTSFKCGTSTSKSISATATSYEFTGSATGNVVISWSQTSKKALYFKSIEITTTSEGTKVFSNEEQAKAWSDYFIKLTGGGQFDGPCKLGTPEAKKAALQQVWGELKSEYVYMVDGSKTAFCSTDATETIAEAVQHYRYIVNTYGLEDFAKVPQVSSSNKLIPISDSEPFIIGIIAMVGLAAIGGYFVFRRRREE